MEYHLAITVARVERRGNSLLVYGHRYDEPIIWLPIVEYDIQPGDVVEWRSQHGVGWYRINERQWWSDDAE